ncbi:5-formyltetrahydrofolate cyclo-ligase [Ulvibacterium sp.]|uniref:5-formyltetrahydrofolate cyclo-ligase n=1 Tax=Ulvibacterium sp. TaxID=2665914 RepID=UPI00263006D9|nr:5-formyltetrahydrofolate cyclo-ligase [Ulvibacterium sp.]
MLKKDLRKQYSKLREEISVPSLINSSLHITNRLLQLPIWSFDYYHIFLSIAQKKEIDTSFTLSILQGRNKNVVVPKVDSNNRLLNCLLSDNTKLKKSVWQIPEPVKCKEVASQLIDVVFIPLLAFDVQGNRVGYGKGFYDRFLKECRSDIIKVGVSLFEAEKSITDISAEDIPLNYCVTPEEIYTFSPS